MSDTTEDTKPDADPNFSAERTTIKFEGQDRKGIAIQFGEPRRSMKVLDLSLSEQFHLIELAGASISNQTWMVMASMAAGVTDVDGVPAMPITSKLDLGKVLDRVKPDGMRAYLQAVELLATKEAAASDESTAAKN